MKSSWIQGDPSIEALLSLQEKKRESWTNCHVQTEVETEVILLQNEECQEPPEAEEARKASPLEP